MCIILLEPPHSCQAAQRAACLVSVKDAKVGKTQGQLLMGPFLQEMVQQQSPRVKDTTMEAR